MSEPDPRNTESELRILEMSLLEPGMRADRSKVGPLIHPDFVEFGSSGNRYNREQILTQMSDETSAPTLIRDFEARMFADGVVLCTYRSIGHGGREVRRSSVWVNSEGQWQIVFHQGTRIPDSWLEPKT